MVNKPTYEELEKRVNQLEQEAILCANSEYLLRQALDTNPNITFVIDENEKIILGNQALADFYGITSDELNGMTQKELHHRQKMAPDELEKWLSDNRKALEAGEPIYILEYGHNKAGERAWYRTRKLPLTLRDDKRAVLVVSENVNEIKQNEEILRKKEAALSMAQKIAHIGNWKWNVQTGKVDWSDEVFRIFGLEHQTISFELAKSLIHPKDLEYWEKSVNEALYHNKPFCIDHRAVRSDGSICWIHNEAEIVRDEKGNPLRVFGTAQDITERKRAEEAFRESEEKHRILFETMLHGVIYHDSKGKIIDANPAAEEILGLDVDEIASRTIIDHRWQTIHEDGSYFQKKTRPSWVALQTGRPVNNMVMGVFNSKEDQYRWIIVNAIPQYRPGEDKPFQIHTTFTDITERKQAEEALKISRENLLEEHNKRKILSKRLIDLLEKDRHDIAMELHDNIGQILTSLKINLEVIDDKLKPIDTELGSLTKDAIKRANQAINDLHNIAQGLMPGILDALGLVSSLRALLNEFREHTDIKIKFFNRNVPKRFDQEKELAIYRIVQEALNNIIKHAEAKNVYVSLLKKGNVLSLGVEDDGVGFDQDKKMKISKGKGPLGLVIMRERAMQLDGELTVESSLGKGTHLLAEIPI